jgi:hypothetical protein
MLATASKAMYKCTEKAPISNLAFEIRIHSKLLKTKNRGAF